MQPLPLLLALVFIATPVTAAPMSRTTPTPPASDAESAVAALLDRFHAAAARADEEAYFACLASDAVFLGTDATERWSTEAFRAYAHPVFARGQGWTYVPEARNVVVDAGGRMAWFDEILTNAKYGRCRGTGVARREATGWLLAQYSLTFLVPNEKAAEVVAVVAAGAAVASPGQPAAPMDAGAPAAAHADSHAHAHDGPHGGAHDATVTHRFDDVERWTKVFDDPERDSWQKPAEVVAALALKPGDAVADIGAGTGYFEPHLARAVGRTGTVLAIDVEPNLVEHLRERAEKEGLSQVVPVLGSYDDPRIPRGLADLVLIVDTYHHVNDRIAYFGRLRESVATGGRLAVVDFIDAPRPVGPPPELSLSKGRVIDELKQAGWTLAADHDLLPWQYVLVFEVAVAAK